MVNTVNIYLAKNVIIIIIIIKQFLKCLVLSLDFICKPLKKRKMALFLILISMKLAINEMKAKEEEKNQRKIKKK